MRCRIVGVDILACGACRLMEMGLTPGTEFTVLKIAPLGDPFEIDLRGGRVCLRRREAECLTVEPVV
ncbi:MAG: FeoA domain-containing protein [Fimbriimonadaceae bacterium]|nr:FeoA domain-containing protein [Fimbriimonadaceae bacterium]QYK55050.1 MAG: FeoA domain-containing protein [Fimbriimonadaceae bacterium]